MKKKFLVAFFVLLVCFGISALTPDFSIIRTALVSDDDDDDEEESSSGEEDEGNSGDAEESEEESVNHSEDDSSDTEEKAEEDPFAKDESTKSKSKKQKDDFVKDSSEDIYPDPEEDDFVVEKREKGVTHQYKEPDLAKVIVATYLYTEASVRSKKLFELYEKDDLVVLEEVNDFYRVQFLGKEGWVPKNDVRLDKWYTYRLSLELAGGVGSGKVNSYNIIGNYTLKLNISIVQDFLVGIEGRGMSFDADNLFGGGGVMLRYYIHGIRSRKTRSALSASAGFLGGVQLINSKKSITGNKFRFSGGPYASVSLDYFFRVWEYIALGVGGDFTYLKTYSSYMGINRNEDLFLGGAHLTLMFNVKR